MNDISGRVPCPLDCFLKKDKIELANEADRRFIEVARQPMVELGTVSENSIYPTDTFHDEIGFLLFGTVSISQNKLSDWKMLLIWIQAQILADHIRISPPIIPLWNIVMSC